MDYWDRIGKYMVISKKIIMADDSLTNLMVGNNADEFGRLSSWIKMNSLNKGKDAYNE